MSESKTEMERKRLARRAYYEKKYPSAKKARLEREEADAWLAKKGWSS